MGVRVELPSNQPIVLLKEVNGERYLPIWIGAVEATAIAFALQGIETPRPMTHDLLRDILSETDVSVDRILITDLVDSTFYATIRMGHDGKAVDVSSRPSMRSPSRSASTPRSTPPRRSSTRPASS